MNASNEQQIVADMTDLVLDRLEAWRSGDQSKVAAIDARAPKDQVSLAALWSAAFGIAERTLNVLEDREPGAADRVLASYREQVNEYRA